MKNQALEAERAEIDEWVKRIRLTIETASKIKCDPPLGIVLRDFHLIQAKELLTIFQSRVESMSEKGCKYAVACWCGR